MEVGAARPSSSESGRQVLAHVVVVGKMSVTIASSQLEI